MDKAKAQQVLGRIDEILRWEQRMEEHKDQKFAELGKHLCEVRDQGYWRLGYVDGRDCLIEWKTTTQCYPANLGRVLELDPQLVCYSWAARWQQVCLVNFVRKKQPEIQYLHARIRKRQWKAFEETLDLLASEIEAGHFYPRSGIRYPNNQCMNCAYRGLCLREKALVEENLMKLEAEEQAVHG